VTPFSTRRYKYKGISWYFALHSTKILRIACNVLNLSGKKLRRGAEKSGELV
jgi:hypothetical protein